VSQRDWDDAHLLTAAVDIHRGDPEVAAVTPDIALAERSAEDEGATVAEGDGALGRCADLCSRGGAVPAEEGSDGFGGESGELVFVRGVFGSLEGKGQARLRAIHVSTTVSGLSDIVSMPRSMSH